MFIIYLIDYIKVLIIIYLTIKKGSAFKWSLRPEQNKIKYVAITAIDNTAPVRIHAEAHGLTNGSYFWVTGSKGLTQLNALNTPPKVSDYFCAEVIDADTVEINRINATQLGTYTTGGYIEYKLPMALTGCTVRGHVRKSEKSEEILLDLGLYATVNTSLSRIDFYIPDSVTEDLVGSGGVYDIEIIDALGDVMSLPKDRIIFDGEVTRDV